MVKVKTTLAYLVLITVSFLFALKYFIEFSNAGLWIAIGLTLIQIALVYSGQRLKLPFYSLKISYYISISVIVIIAFAASLYIDRESLNVDRWSVINSFLDELFSGNYPYFARSHMGNLPGPMPFYFLLALPFKLLNALSFFGAIGYILIAGRLSVKTSGHNLPLLLIILLLSSPYMYWEIVVRSNIFTNAALVLFALTFFLKIDKENISGIFILSAAITGLMMSTRAIFIIPYILFIIPSLTKKEITFRNFVVYIASAVLTFSFTFIPVIFGHMSDFMAINPILIQSTFLVPVEYVIIFFLITLICVPAVKTRSDRFFFSGIVLFIIVLIYSLYHIISKGFEEAFYESIIDISYFISCIPFLILYLIENKKEPEHYEKTINT